MRYQSVRNATDAGEISGAVSELAGEMTAFPGEGAAPIVPGECLFTPAREPRDD